MMYVNDIKCMSRLFNALVQQLFVGRLGISAEISLPKIHVEMTKAVQSGMMELEKRINKTSSTFVRVCSSSELQ